MANRLVRIRLLGGVGGVRSNAAPIPIGLFRSRQRAVQLERVWLDRRFVRFTTQGGAAFAELMPLTLGYGI